jgi:hypothetical protein
MRRALFGRLISWRSVVVVATVSVGCNDTSIAPPKVTPEETRFELRQDNRGRVIRLNKRTGEMSVVDGTRVTPLRDVAGSNPRPPAPQPADSVLRGSSVQRPTQRPPKLDERAEMPAGPVHVALPGQLVRVTTTAPVFLESRAMKTPLEVLDPGVTLKVLDNEGDWYRVEFVSNRFGQRVGYISTSKALAIEATDEPASPVDLSVPDLQRPSQLKPIDLSIRKPVDLSIRDRK